MNSTRRSKGFTLIEIIIVVVIIGILTTISIVSYSGITDRANADSLKSDLVNASDFLRVDQAQSSKGWFPDTLAFGNGGLGITASKGTTLTYNVNNTNTPKTFCVTATKNAQSYNINQEGIPFAGPCPVLWLDAGITTSYPGTGAVLTDLSGNGNNGTLNSGVTYSPTNGGTFTFDGTSGIISLGTNIQLGTGDFTVSVWVKINSTQATGATFHAIVDNKTASAASAGFGLVWNNSTNKFLWSTADGTNATEIWSTNAWNTTVLDKWAQVVIIRQSGVTNNGHFYINGAYESIVSSAAIRNVNSSNQLNLGNTGVPYGSYYFTGSIGDVRIYNRALSADEISKNFGALRSRYGI